MEDLDARERRGGPIATAAARGFPPRAADFRDAALGHAHLPFATARSSGSRSRWSGGIHGAGLLRVAIAFAALERRGRQTRPRTTRTGTRGWRIAAGEVWK
jgi:hypothetical protein